MPACLRHLTAFCSQQGGLQDASGLLHAREWLGTALDARRFYAPWTMGIHITDQSVQQEGVVHEPWAEYRWPRVPCAPQPYPRQRRGKAQAGQRRVSKLGGIVHHRTDTIIAQQEH